MAGKCKCGSKEAPERPLMGPGETSAPSQVSFLQVCLSSYRVGLIAGEPILQVDEQRI